MSPFRGGNPTKNRRKGDTRDPNVTRLIDCPFSASAYFQKKANHWKFSVSNPHHNHQPSLDPTAHTANRRLTEDIYEEMKKLGDSGMKPSAILDALKKTRPNETILATISTIYTARKKAHQQMLQGISPIVHLNKTLSSSDFTTATKVNDDGELEGLFFCHALSINLLKSYHYVLLLDCTYKTNKYKMPLLHIAGITGANKTFSLAFCFIAQETKPFYDWALDSLLTVFTSNNIPQPDVFLTDREQALINSVTSAFPNSTHLLCTWHIQKNIVTNAAKLIKNKAKEGEMISAWNELIRRPSQSDFHDKFQTFASKYGAKFEEYMYSTWLPVAEKYSNAWTKSIPHFEHRTTSRMESAHSFIKSRLLGPNYSFTAVIKIITNALEAQLHEISAHYHQQKINSLKYIGKILHDCHGRITHFALRKAQNNLVLASHLTAAERDECNGCHHTRTGIPCKHRLAELINRGETVQPKEFHEQWHIKVSLIVCCVFFVLFFFFLAGGIWESALQFNIKKK